MKKLASWRCALEWEDVRRLLTLNACWCTDTFLYIISAYIPIQMKEKESLANVKMIDNWSKITRFRKISAWYFQSSKFQDGWCERSHQKLNVSFIFSMLLYYLSKRKCQSLMCAKIFFSGSSSHKSWDQPVFAKRFRKKKSSQWITMISLYKLFHSVVSYSHVMHLLNYNIMHILWLWFY